MNSRTQNRQSKVQEFNEIKIAYSWGLYTKSMIDHILESGRRLCGSSSGANIPPGAVPDDHELEVRYSNIRRTRNQEPLLTGQDELEADSIG